MSKAFMSWSGGKDSSLCLHKIKEQGMFDIDCLLTNINSDRDRISMHDVRRELLTVQAASIGISLETIQLPDQPGMQEYESATRQKFDALKTRGCHHAIFGDIFLEDLRTWRETRLAQQDIQAVFPLWKIDTTTLMEEFLALGFKAIVICVNTRWLDKSFCGRLIDASFVRDLPDNVDLCGENGEYHSFVFDGPLFRAPVSFRKGDIVYKEYRGAGSSDPAGFYFCDLLPT